MKLIFSLSLLCTLSPMHTLSHSHAHSLAHSLSLSLSLALSSCEKSVLFTEKIQKRLELSN